MGKHDNLAAKIFNLYKNEVAKKYKPLSDEEWEELLSRLGEDCSLEDRDKAVTHGLLFATYAIKEFLGRGVSQLDLVQEATLGLMEAVRTFDRSKGGKFTTWAYQYIRQKAMEAIRLHGTPVKRPSNPNSSKLRRFVGNFEQEFFRLPHLGEIALELGLSEKQIVSAMETKRLWEDNSLNRPAPDGDNEEGLLIRRLPNQAELAPDDYAVARDELALACQRLHNLFGRRWTSVRPHMREIFLLRYGINGERGRKTYQEIAERFSLSRQAATQIVERVLEKLVWRGQLENKEERFSEELRKIEELAELVGEEVDFKKIIP